MDAHPTTPILRTVDEEEEDAERERRLIKQIVWRDFVFLLLAIAASLGISFIEVNAGDASLRGGVADERGIVDTGFIATTALHAWLENNRDWNDVFALLNTLLCVLLPGLYLVYVTLWAGDYDLAFRYLSTQVLRSICGWFTYLPSSPEYLMSYKDVPDVFQCLTKNCGDPAKEAVQPFVSFFSGHVATMVCCANHMYLHGYQRLGVMCHAFNVLQIVRLLATRGHYSIDIIIGWYVALYVSRSAGRLGRYYSRGAGFRDLGPKSRKEAFERFIGVSGEMRSRRMSRMIKKENLQETLLSLERDDLGTLKESVLETTAKLVAEGKLTPSLHGSGSSSPGSSEKKKKKAWSLHGSGSSPGSSEKMKKKV